MCLMTAHLAGRAERHRYPAGQGHRRAEDGPARRERHARQSGDRLLAHHSVRHLGRRSRFPGMPPGTYALTVEMQGFKTVGRREGGAAGRHDERALGRSADRQPVGVGPGLGRGAGHQLQRCQHRQRDRRRTRSARCPLEGRNVAALLSLQPGVTYVPKSDPGATMDPALRLGERRPRRPEHRDARRHRRERPAAGRPPTRQCCA